MIKSSVTISLVPKSKNGPFIFWDDMAKSCSNAASIGFDGVEIFTPNAESINRNALELILRENNLKLAAIGTGAGYLLKKLSLCDPNANRRRESIKFIADIIELAGSFGAMVIVGSMQGKAISVKELTKAKEWLREGLDELGILAKKCHVTLLLEPLNRYETNLINRLQEGVEFLEPLQNNNIKLLADLFHMNIEEESICNALRQAGSYIGHVHFADSNRRPPGHGHVNFAEVSLTLKEIKYDGFISVEALPYPNPLEAAKQSMRFYKKLFAANSMC